MVTKTMVFAGNHQQAVEWARSEDLSPDQWEYVSSDRWLRGRRGGVPRVFVGTFYERRDMRQMIEALEIADLVSGVRR